MTVLIAAAAIAIVFCAAAGLIVLLEWRLH